MESYHHINKVNCVHVHTYRCRAHFCDSTVAVHSRSIQTLTINIPQPTRENILLDPHAFVSLNFTYPLFSSFAWTTCVTLLRTPGSFKSNSSAGRGGYSKQCFLNGVQWVWLFTECLWSVSNCVWQQWRSEFPCDLNPLPFQESGLFSL